DGGDQNDEADGGSDQRPPPAATPPIFGPFRRFAHPAILNAGRPPSRDRPRQSGRTPLGEAGAPPAQQTARRARPGTTTAAGFWRATGPAGPVTVSRTS